MTQLRPGKEERMLPQGFLIEQYYNDTAEIVLPDRTIVQVTPEALMAYLDCEGDFRDWHGEGDTPVDPYDPYYTILSYYEEDELIVEEPEEFQARLAVYGVHPDKDSLGLEILYDDPAEFLLASKPFWRLNLKDHHKPHGLMAVKKNLRVFDHLRVDEDKTLYLRRKKGHWEEYVNLYFDQTKETYIRKTALKTPFVYLLFRGNPRERTWEPLQDRCFNEQQALRNDIESLGLKWTDAQHVNRSQKRWFWKEFIPATHGNDNKYNR